MMRDVYNQENQAIRAVELPDECFSVRWNPALVGQVLRAELANKRQPWAHAKGRGEVRGGGRKPWRQKGTGRARHGSIRSPLWRGGGKSHGPEKERDYSQKINKKMKQLATLSALSKKVSDGEVKIVEHLTLQEPKTKLFARMLHVLLPSRKRAADLLVVRAMENKALPRAARNIPKTKVVSADGLNVYDLLNHRHLFIEEGAVRGIVAHYAKKQ